MFIETGDLYVYEDVLFTVEQAEVVLKQNPGVEFDYVYYTPYIFNLGGQRKVVANFDLDQMEIVEDKQGLLGSIAIIRNEDVINMIFELLGGVLDDGAYQVVPQ